MSLIWGSILVLFGAQLIIQAIFGVYIPLARVAFGLIIVYLGVMILTDNWSWFSYRNTYTYSKQYTHTQDSHNVIFGTQNLDFSTINPDTEQTVTVNSIFGTTRILLNKDIPTVVNASATFGTIKFPDHSELSNGSRTYYSHHTHNHNEPVLTINANTTFGTIAIKNHS